MSKFFKKHFVHFVLFVFEAASSYLHKNYELFYGLDCHKVSIEHKKEVNEDA